MSAEGGDEGLELPDPRDRLSQEERERLQEVLDEWVIDAEGVAPHVAS